MATKIVSYSINDKTLNDFKEEAKKQSINASKLIENFMLDWLKKSKTNE
jgi:hypothetical protein